MRTAPTALVSLVTLLCLGTAGCGNSGGDGTKNVLVVNPLENPANGPPAGNASGGCAIPAEAAPADTSSPRTVVGDGTAASCTGSAVVAAVAAGGVITFDCGPDPVTITLTEPARVFNDTPGGDVVLDGGGLVTLSGGGTTRILYMNTCDESLVWTTDHCDNQDHPRLTVQNITFTDGAHDGSSIGDDGGGAIYASGGRLRAVNTRFFNNHCAVDATEVGGGGIRAFQQYQDLPIYVVNSTFGGAEGYGNACSNGGGISSIGVSWTIINSVFSYNQATASDGSGGAIYNDGATMTLSLCGSIVENNSAVNHGGGIFFVSNNHDGTLRLTDSTFRNNTDSSGWHIEPGISGHDDTVEIFSNTTFAP